MRKAQWMWKNDNNDGDDDEEEVDPPKSFFFQFNSLRLDAKKGQLENK